MSMALKLTISPASRPPLPTLQLSHFPPRQNLSPSVRASSPGATVIGTNQSFLSPPNPPKRDRSVTSKAGFQLNVNAPLISAHDQWGIWTVLFATGAFGIWSEKNTKIGSALSGALMSILIGLAASSLGIISSNSPAYSIVLEFLLPLAVPLLLYRADLRRVVKSTGALLLAFLVGSARTVWERGNKILTVWREGILLVERNDVYSLTDRLSHGFAAMVCCLFFP